MSRRPLAAHPLGRLATIGPAGAPHVRPVAFWPTGEPIDIGGPALPSGQELRNVHVEIEVLDRSLTPGFGNEVLRMRARRVIAWDVPGRNARDTT